MVHVVLLDILLLLLLLLRIELGKELLCHHLHENTLLLVLLLLLMRLLLGLELHEELVELVKHL